MKRKDYKFVLLISCISLIIYSNTFHSPFLFDDELYITNNYLIRDLSFFTKPFQVKEGAVFGSGEYNHFKMRYLGLLTFALNYRIHGLDVTGYHVINLLIHIVNGILVYFLTLLSINLLSDKPSEKGLRLIALFSALLFICHPIQTQAVAYITQRFTTLSSMFYLTSLLAFVRWRTNVEQEKMGTEILHFCGKKAGFILYVISILSGIAAMKTKEIAFTLPVIITIYEFLFLKEKINRKVRILLPFWLMMLIIPLSLVDAGQPLGNVLKSLDNSTRVLTDVSRWDYLFTQFRVIVTYIRLLFFPINQNLDYDYPVYHSFFQPEVMLSFLLMLSIIGVGFYLIHRYIDTAPATRMISFGIFWFFIVLTVESSIIPLVDLIFEHRLYLPSVGFSFITAGLLAMSEKKFKFKVSIIIIAALIILVGFSYATYKRNNIWRNGMTLWMDTVSKSPNKARPHYNLGLIHDREGRQDDALREYLIAARATDDIPDLHNNIGIIYVSKGFFDKAISEFESELRRYPNNYKARENLAFEYYKSGRLEEASREYQTAKYLRMKYESAYNP